MIKTTYKVLGMHCTSCSLLIESDLEDAGVKAVCSYVKETLEVEYDEKKVMEVTIFKTVRASGYEVV
ncbi:MAG: cation transporter [Patescibacteria group bacterium]